MTHHQHYRILLLLLCFSALPFVHTLAHITRRTWLSSPALLGLLTPHNGLSASPVAAVEYATSDGRGPNCITRSDPSRTVVSCPPRLIGSDGRLASIASTENGVSTSAIRNPSAYASPWSYLPETSDASKAWKSLVTAVSSLPDVELVTEDDAGYYLHAVVPSTSGGADRDDVECVLRPDDRVVLFRSASRTSVFVYPVTRPVSDRNANRQRLENLRQRLGWAELN